VHLVVRVIKPSRLALLTIVAIALPALPVHAMDAGIYTIIDGDVRVLRGATWFRLVPGARLLEGDVIDVAGQGQAQLELTQGATLNAQGPASLHAALVAAPDGKPAAVAEIVVAHGWLKAAATKGQPLRVRTAMMAVTLADAVVVANCDARHTELFVESGTTSVALPRSKDVPRDATSGEFVTRADDRAPVVANRAPAAFLTAMPRPFRDALPALAGRFAVAPEALVKGRDISLAEADPWLAGANRKSFIKRFTPRLADPVFRAAVAARPSAYPEWDRIIHPERYRPKETTDAK
jgi:hypothetical protein